MSYENVDTADAKNFLAQMSSHTLSEIKYTSSANEAVSKANTFSPPGIQCPHCKRPIALESVKNNTQRSTGGGECAEKRGSTTDKFTGVNIGSDGSEHDLNSDSDSDADSFDLELEEKLFTFQQAQAVQHIEASEWVDAELLINRVLSNGRVPSFGGYNLTDWRIFLGVVQLAQDSFAAGLQTLKTIDNKEATLTRLAFLLFTVTLQFCKTGPDSNLKLAEKYCLKTIKTFRKAEDMDNAALATDVMSQILRQKGDVHSSKFYLSILPKGRDSIFKDFLEVEGSLLLTREVLEKPRARELSVTIPMTRDLSVTQTEKATALCSEEPSSFADKLAKFNLAVKNGRLSGTQSDVERAFESILDEDDVPFARFLLEDANLLTGIDWTKDIYAQCGISLMKNIVKTHKTMAIPNIVMAGGQFPSISMKDALIFSR